jgi:hypothetical protein
LSDDRQYIDRQVMGLIGEEGFAQLLVGMPDEFFRMERGEQDEVWKAILRKINEGIRESEKLAMFAEEWLRLYRFFGQTERCISC